MFPETSTAPENTTACAFPMANGAGSPVGSAVSARWTTSSKSRAAPLWRRWNPSWAGPPSRRRPLRPFQGKKRRSTCFLPPPAPDNRAMLQYLAGRGISMEVLDFCVQTGRIYESRNRGHGNVVFVGFDKTGKGAVRLPARDWRGPVPRGFKRQRQALFLCPARLRENPAVHLCECAIDVMSYASLCRLNGIDWKQHNLLSLAGIYQPKKRDCREQAARGPHPFF